MRTINALISLHIAQPCQHLCFSFPRLRQIVFVAGISNSQLKNEANTHKNKFRLNAIDDFTISIIMSGLKTRSLGLNTLGTT